MGLWKGWYEQDGQRSEMTIGKFKVKENKISGSGEDPNGKFEFIGFYGPDGTAHFVKQYKGAHQVKYEGKREGQTITGTWSLMGMSGPFHLYKERKWAGHYVQNGSHEAMHIDSLKFKKGTVSGRGEDTNGKFEISGTIEKNGAVHFTKQYIGKHAVQYNGQRNYHEIKGTWSVPDYGISDEFFLQKQFSEENDHSSDSD